MPRGDSSKDEERPAVEAAPEAPAAGAPKLRRKFESRLADLDAEIGRREAELQAGPTPEKQAALRIAQKERELYVFEHDEAGAKVGGLWGAEFARELGERIPNDSTDGFEPSGVITPSPEDARTHTLVVNTGELDRFNAQGGHDAGNRALETTVAVTEEVISEELVAAGITDPNAYDIYRFSGNDFAVSLRGVAPEVADRIRDRISEKRPEIIPGKDALPVAAIRFSREEVVSTINDAIRESGAALSPKEARDLVIDTTRRVATVAGDAEKFVARAARVKEKLGPPPAPDLDEFWTKFMQKSFKGTEFEDLGAIREAAADEARFTERALEVAFKKAESDFVEDAKFSDSIRKVLAGRLAEIFAGRPAAIPEVKRGAAEKPKREEFSSPGLETIRGKKAAADAARERAQAAEEGTPEREAADLAAREAELDFQIEKARRDGATGLLGRREYYRKLEDRIAKGEKCGVVFVDMAFLKYFDKEGKGDTGEYALRKAAQIMEQAIADTKISAEAFRYAGDEFTIQFSGDAAEGQKILARVAELAEKMDPVAGSEKATSRFRPERLLFNYGVADTRMLGLAAERVQADPSVPEYKKGWLSDPNQRAELITKLADVGIESQKAENRLLFLTERLRDPRHKKDEAYTEQINALLAYSEKAIIGAKEKDFEAWGKMKAREKSKAIREFVAEGLRAKEKDLEHLDQAMLELNTREMKVIALERQLDRSARLLDRAQRKYGEEHAVVVQLQKRIEQMERERQELIEARGKAIELAKAA